MKKWFLACALLILALTGCGTSRIISSNPKAEIYINNTYRGVGEISVTRAGLPQKINITARYNGLEVGSICARRQVMAISFFVGYVTYGVGFFLTWKYPKTITIPLQEKTSVSTFDSLESIWNLPPEEGSKKSKW